VYPAALIAAAGYTISHAAIVDLYPNTHHVETVLILKSQ
jgi:tRNA/tmRNA/rRNA uracil-C5-methylase (TrmA/RlmC/RlmD family)